MVYVIQYKLNNNDFKSIHTFRTDILENALSYAHFWKDMYFKESTGKVYLLNEQDDIRLNLL